MHRRRILIRPWRGAYLLQPDKISRVQALFRLLPPYARLSDASAAAWYGFGEGSTDICVTVPQGYCHPRFNGVRVHESVLPLPDPIWINDVPLLPPERVAVTLARTSRRLDALPLLDGALRTGLITVDQLIAEVAGHAGLRGVVQARELIPLADGRAECRQESQLRLIVIDAGLPAPEPQLEIGWYRIDLGYRRHRVGMEYDGRSHLTRERLRHDRRRMNWLSAAGWTMRHFTDVDLYRHPTSIVRAVRPLVL